MVEQKNKKTKYTASVNDRSHLFGIKQVKVNVRNQMLSFVYITVRLHFNNLENIGIIVDLYLLKKTIILYRSYQWQKF
jgi:hypothetical protein